MREFRFVLYAARITCRLEEKYIIMKYLRFRRTSRRTLFEWAQKINTFISPSWPLRV